MQRIKFPANNSKGRAFDRCGFLRCVGCRLAIGGSGDFFYVEVLLAVKSNDAHAGDPGAAAGTAAVLVPAHNESQNLVPTLLDIRAQLGEGDRLVVVADNCTDDTAEVARACQAEVIVRNCPEKRGKSYALDWGVRNLGEVRPDTVIIVDADCRLGPPGAAETQTGVHCDATAGPGALSHGRGPDVGVGSCRRKICLARQESGPPARVACGEIALPTDGYRDGIAGQAA